MPSSPLSPSFRHSSTTRSVTLTDEGRRFYEEVNPHLNAIEDAAVIASGAISAVRGRLKVDIDPIFLPLVLAGRLGASRSGSRQHGGKSPDIVDTSPAMNRSGSLGAIQSLVLTPQAPDSIETLARVE